MSVLMNTNLIGLIEYFITSFCLVSINRTKFLCLLAGGYFYIRSVYNCHKILISITSLNLVIPNSEVLHPLMQSSLFSSLFLNSHFSFNFLLYPFPLPSFSIKFPSKSFQYIIILHTPLIYCTLSYSCIFFPLLFFVPFP